MVDWNISSSQITTGAETGFMNLNENESVGTVDWSCVGLYVDGLGFDGSGASQVRSIRLLADLHDDGLAL